MWFSNLKLYTLNEMVAASLSISSTYGWHCLETTALCVYIHTIDYTGKFTQENMICRKLNTKVI